MHHSLLRQPYILPLLSGILAALAFNNSFLWPLVFGALVPFFVFLYKSKSQGKSAFVGGLIFGLTFYGAAISWFLSAHPLTWAGITSPVLSFVVAFLVWILSVAAMAVFTGLFALAVSRLKKVGLWSTALIPALWVTFEHLQAWGFSIFWAGPGSFISPHWTTGFLGYPLAENTLLLSLAGLGGIYLLSFFVVFVNTCTTLYLLRQKRAFLYTLFGGLALVLLVALFSLSMPATKKTPLTIAAAHSNVSPSFKITEREYRGRIAPIKKELFALLGSDNPPDIILLPEDLRILGFLSPKEAGALERAKNLSKPILIIDSGETRRPSDGASVSAMIYYNTKEGVLGRYDKMFSVPQGEYLSFIVRFAAFVGGQGRWVEEFDAYRSRAKGAGVRAASFDDTRVGALFCSEIVADNLYADTTVGQGAEILANASSHTVFGGDRLLALQTIHMARVRAVENSRPFVLSGNGTPAFTLDHRGRLTARTSKELGGTASFIVATVTPITSTSPYNKMGGWVLLVSFVLIGFAVLRQRRNS